MSAITLQQIQDDPDRKDIFGLLNEYIQPGSTTSASRAALSFAQGVKKPDEAFFWRFWDDVFDVAAQIRHDHPAQDRLVAFARELALVPETGEKVWVVSFLCLSSVLALLTLPNLTSLTLSYLTLLYLTLTIL